MNLAFHPECMYELCPVLMTDIISPPHAPHSLQQQLGHRKWHVHLTTGTEGPLVTLVQVSLKSVPPPLTVRCLASYQIFIYIQFGEYDQLRAWQHIAFVGCAMELATRELGLDSWQGKGFFSSSWYQSGIWGTSTLPCNMKQGIFPCE